MTKYYVEIKCEHCGKYMMTEIDIKAPAMEFVGVVDDIP